MGLHGLRVVLLAGVMALVSTPAAAGAASATQERPDPVLVALQRLNSTVPPEALAAHRATYTLAVAHVRRLGGVRRRELRSVVAIVRGMAARGALTPRRLPLVFLTLQRNAHWWARHGPPRPGSPGEPDARGRRCRPLPVRARASRITFPGSSLVWQYYPGLGIQLQVNGTFAAANALLRSTKPGAREQAAAILDEMRRLTTVGGRRTTWEYVFPFGGGRPPWRSGLAQATAIRAYLNGAAVLGRPELVAVARQLSGLFAFPPPAGVNVRLGRDGSWYALYSFAPRQHVLNAQLNAVIALHDLDKATGDAGAHVLAREGLRATRRHIARFNTGVWSRYARRGPLADLNYHVLNRDLAQQLCRRTAEAAICRAARSFTAQLERRCPRLPTPLSRPAS